MLSHALRADKSERIEEVAHVALDHLLTHIQARPGEQDDKNTNSLCLGWDPAYQGDLSRAR